jgi:hypothetical protein
MKDIEPVANLLKENDFTIEQKIQENRINISFDIDEKIMKTKEKIKQLELQNKDQANIIKKLLDIIKANKIKLIISFNDND